jgi:hypothetical protein
MINQPSIDPVWLVGNLPAELKLAIKNYTFLFQMQERFATDDLQIIAGHICCHRPAKVDPETKACWLSTLVSVLCIKNQWILPNAFILARLWCKH